MKTRATLFGLLSALTATSVFAAEGPVPQGIPPLNHVFLIMMENHGYGQIIGNPDLPMTNAIASEGNTASNYFAVAHPSLTNYLEIVGGSNFGVHADNYPDWHNSYCSPNLLTGSVSTDNPPTPAICPISGVGTDAATSAIDTTNETTGLPGVNNIDGTQSIAAAANTSGKTIADQLAEVGGTWKTYQENLPPHGADGVNYSDGVYTNNTNFANVGPAVTPLTSASLVFLYAAKHNPFVYFSSIQEGTQPGSGLTNVVGYDGPRGLYADLATGNVPQFSFIVPNQCNDQHGRGNAGDYCAFDPNDNGTLVGLNPALMQRGDVALNTLVTSIKSSPVWKAGNNAIVVVWDEDDYSVTPTVNKVLVIVDTNYGSHGIQSTAAYNHFSLLKSIEGGLGLPCLNHACDSSVNAMTDLFGVAMPSTSLPSFGIRQDRPARVPAQ